MHGELPDIGGGSAIQRRQLDEKHVDNVGKRDSDGIDTLRAAFWRFESFEL